ncbi:hypothetical protein FRB90_012071 [Tulasnella sp. 427]|nr:hypothetical protein FRB90_012071 [Tulasnella sp. 427]
MEKTLGVARGLEYLHCHPEKICHGDVKPNNVILGDDYTPRLCDFGLSDAMSGKTKQYRTSGKAPGSANYEPFETWYEGTRSLAGDIFALAGVVLMIMSSQAPFNTMKRDLIGILKLLPEEKPDPSDHPLFPLEDPLWLMMNQCWAKDPIARPVIADCIKAVLEALGRYSKIELGV